MEESLKLIQRLAKLGLRKINHHANINVRVYKNTPEISQWGF